MPRGTREQQSMSGIAGIVNFDGRPVDAALMDRLTHKMQPWAPDESRSVVAGNFGLGYAQLRSTDESARERQPFTLHGNVHVLADARIDARAELIEALKGQGRRVAFDAPDVELIGHAYMIWGRGCVDRLLGDFSFAIWDAKRRQLFCARDHFGVKPLFYADMGNTFVFSNALGVVRSHPEVGDKLNELAIADFMLFGFNQALDTTSFADIRRLAPAHTLFRSMRDRAVTERYWTLPTGGAVRYRRQWDYVEHFKELFKASVADRLRGNRIGVLMSGGLDSTSVASMAHDLLSDGRDSFDMRLCTNVYDRSIPDDERQYAQRVAQALNVPIHFEAADDSKLHTGWDRPGIDLPEPAEMFEAERESHARREFTANCRVMLTGLGGDPLLAAPRAYLVNRFLRGEWAELVRGLWACMSTHGHLPSLGIRTLLTGRLRVAGPSVPMPEWLNRDFVTRLNLKARWDAVMKPNGAAHRRRPEAYLGLGDRIWPYVFGTLDPGFGGTPVEHRHPFFDVRLASYVLAMPTQPWFERKALLRGAMKGMLPDAVRLRPKTVLCGYPAHAVAATFDRECRERLLSAPSLSSFVDRNAVPVHIWNKAALDSLDYYANSRAFSLGYWLSYCWPAAQMNTTRGAT